MSGWNVGLALPEWILAGSVLAALAADARGMGEWVRRFAWFGVFAATATAALQGLLRLDDGTRLYAFHGRYGLDAFAVVFKILFGATSLFILAMSGQWLQRVDRGHGEFRLLALMATLGMFFACSVEDFASLFVSLELITVCFYCLAAFKRNDERSVEAGIKYVILGGLASAFLLLGIAFIYGATGSLEIRALAAQADDLGHGGASLLQFGVLLAIVGLAFKIAAVPFQVWTPDVYEGAASPVTAFLSMGSKAAGFVLLLKVVRACLGPSADAGLADPDAARWLALVAVMAGTTLLYGNLGAMWQGNIKRLLGYSSIGHAGYALMGVFALSEAGFAAVVYYLMAYLFTVLGVFAVIILVNGATKSHRIDDYSGLGRRSPFLALVLTVGLLSLAGVPPLGGFFGKFLIFQAVVARGTALAYALAFVGAAGVVISLYYYLCVVKRIYMHEPGPDAPETIAVPGSMKIVLWTCLIGMFVLGIFMGPFVKLAQEAAHALVAAR